MPSNPPHLTTRQLVLRVVLGAFVLAIPSVLVTRLAVNWAGGPGGALPQAQAILAHFGPWAPLALVLLVAGHGAVPYPATPIIVAGLILYGPQEGFFLGWIGMVLAGLLGYAIARLLGRPIVKRLLNPATLQKVDAASRSMGPYGVLLGRILPIPTAIISYAAGLSGVKALPFVWATAAGLVPSLLGLALLVGHAQNLMWDLLTGVGMALMAAVAVVLGGRRFFTIDDSPPAGVVPVVTETKAENGSHASQEGDPDEKVGDPS